ncbi:TPA: hypothetical protein ACH3X1_012681 [Trebouxia sp. C0004]
MGLKSAAGQQCSTQERRQSSVGQDLMQETSVTGKGEQRGPQLKGMYSDTRAAQRVSQTDQQRASNAARQARLMQQQVIRWQQQPWQQMKGQLMSVCLQT